MTYSYPIALHNNPCSLKTKSTGIYNHDDFAFSLEPLTNKSNATEPDMQIAQLLESTYQKTEGMQRSHETINYGPQWLKVRKQLIFSSLETLVFLIT
jgi:hypothetical protein